MKRALIALLASLVLGSALGQSPEPAKIRITTWNLEWFPNGSPHDATPEKQAQRIEAAADVLRKPDPNRRRQRSSLIEREYCETT